MLATSPNQYYGKLTCEYNNEQNTLNSMFPGVHLQIKGTCCDLVFSGIKFIKKRSIWNI